MNDGDCSHLYTPRERRSQRKKSKQRVSSLRRSHSQHDVTTDTSSPTSTLAELSVDNRAPGLLKVFGELVVEGAQYKSVLASTRSTAQELIKQALERYGLSSRLYRDFVLCETVGLFTVADDFCVEGSNNDNNNNHHNNNNSNETNAVLSKKTSTQRLAKRKHTFRRLNSKFVEDRSPCGSPRSPDESPRTPLGSPRTPHGSPSTVRESPRVMPGDGEPDGGLWQRHPTNAPSSGCPSPRQWKTHLKSYQERADSQEIDHRLKWPQGLPRSISNSQTWDNGTRGHKDNEKKSGCYWKPISIRVLIPSDRPLELQEFWKPPEGYSRRYELRRRCDVTMEAVDTETLGLNRNARKIMMSKLSPGVIPYSSQHRDMTESKTTLKEEWDRASGTRNQSTGTSSGAPATNVVEGDPRQAYVCPSIYPYLLTLRGCSIHKDLVLYPLKSMSLTIGSADKKLNSDDIKLSSEDIAFAHCRVTLKRMPQFDVTVAADDQRQYWYCLDLEIVGSSFVTVNGVQAKHSATVYPGDLLGIGRQYLFLYKDPTGGHDIPSAVPWLPEGEGHTSHLAHINVNSNDNINSINSNNNANNVMSNSSLQRSIPNLHLEGDFGERLEELGFNDEDSHFLDDSTSRNTPIFLAYHKDKEVELLESIADIKCHTTNSFPLTHSLLFLASHQYAVRKFPGDHQTTFFKRLARVVRARIGVVSRSLSQQRRESAIFMDGQSEKSSPSDKDYFPCLINWLANIVYLMGHLRMPTFQTDVNNLARRNDVIAAVQDVIGIFESSVNFLFQQTVYNVTKVLYDPINKFMESANPEVSESSVPVIGRIISILEAMRRQSDDLKLHADVANQLMVYLLFFVSTTLFNRIIAKGSKLYNRVSGSRLHKGISQLEEWANQEGLDVEFVRVSEHILSMTELLSSSKRTLLKLDWHSFQTQFSPLTDVQLCKILGEYHLGQGATHPQGWLPPYPVDAKDELTISLSSHPPFFLPQQGKLINLCETFPPAFYRHLEQIQQKFSLVGEDVYCSGLSSAGNTPRLSESFGRGGNIATFFSQDLASSIRGTNQNSSRDHANKSGLNAVRPNSNHDKRTPPPPPPKPYKGPKVSQNPGTHETEEHIPTPNSQHPPPYNVAVKRGMGGQTNPRSIPKPTKSVEPERRSPFVRPIVVQHGSSTDFSGAHHKQLPLNTKQMAVLPNMSDVHLLQRKSDNCGMSQRPSKTSDGILQNSVSAFNQSRDDITNLSSSYPTNHPRPSSATECVHSSLTAADWQSAYQSSNKKNEPLYKRSNSALGCRHNKDIQEGRDIGHESSYDVTNRTLDKFGGNSSSSFIYEHNSNSASARQGLTTSSENMIVDSHRNKEENSSHRPQNKNNSQDQREVGINSFSYGSLKRSPRNLNLSKQSSSELRNATNTATLDKLHPVDSEEGGDKPPPIPPRGDLSRRMAPSSSRSSPGLQPSIVRRGSPQEFGLSSSHRSRSGSRTSVEIQDITENQYIIYNPESPVVECFEHAKVFPTAGYGSDTQSHRKAPVFDRSKEITLVPPLQLPDDLLGISETDSADDIFANSYSKDFDKQQSLFDPMVQQVHSHRSDSRGSQSHDTFPDDIYIDVQDFNLEDSDSGAKILKVLPLEQNTNSDVPIYVRYRHSMPASRDNVTQGEVTGEVFAVTLHKAGSKLGMGLIDGLHTPLKMQGIFVRNVLPDTPAALCGCIRVGDRIVAVNGKSIVGADYDSAMRLIRADGPQLNLLVAKCDSSVASKISASNA